MVIKRPWLALLCHGLSCFFTWEEVKALSLTFQRAGVAIFNTSFTTALAFLSCSAFWLHLHNFAQFYIWYFRCPIRHIENVNQFSNQLIASVATLLHANFVGLLEAVARGIISTRIYTLKESRDQFISPFPIKGRSRSWYTDIWYVWTKSGRTKSSYATALDCTTLLVQLFGCVAQLARLACLRLHNSIHRIWIWKLVSWN